MKRFLFIALAIIISAGVFAQSDQEKKAIIKTIDKAYVQGIHNASDIDNINKGFHPGFNLLGIDNNNNITKYPIYTWEAGVRKRVEAGQLPKVETTAKYPLIDITGHAAVAKVELFREGTQIYTDYLFLYKFEEGWRIVSKVYYTTPKE
jgi:hypothetical protein